MVRGKSGAVIELDVTKSFARARGAAIGQRVQVVQAEIEIPRLIPRGWNREQGTLQPGEITQGSEGDPTGKKAEEPESSGRRSLHLTVLIRRPSCRERWPPSGESGSSSSDDAARHWSLLHVQLEFEDIRTQILEPGEAFTDHVEFQVVSTGLSGRVQLDLEDVVLARC